MASLAPVVAASARTRACCDRHRPIRIEREVVASQLGRVGRLADLRDGREPSGGGGDQRVGE